jgi:hypothetical protein
MCHAKEEQWSVGNFRLTDYVQKYEFPTILFSKDQNDTKGLDKARLKI